MLVDRGVRGVKADTVVVDNLVASRDAVAHLNELGHRRIAILAEAGRRAVIDDGQPEPTSGGRPVLPSAARLAGYLQAMERAGLPVAEELIWITPYRREAAAAETASVLQLPDRATAIFSTGALITLGAIEAI